VQRGGACRHLLPGLLQLGRDGGEFHIAREDEIHERRAGAGQVLRHRWRWLARRSAVLAGVSSAADQPAVLTCRSRCADDATFTAKHVTVASSSST
jgi:hypothetical protein